MHYLYRLIFNSCKQHNPCSKNINGHVKVGKPNGASNVLKPKMYECSTIPKNHCEITMDCCLKSDT